MCVHTSIFSDVRFMNGRGERERERVKETDSPSFIWVVVQSS